MLLLILLLLVELFINPIGDFALNDDWAYGKSVYHFNKYNEFVIGLWPAMSLYSHALLGLVFVKLFGFSFTVLRFANMFLCIVTLFHLYKFFCKKNTATISALVCAFIVFNPFYMNIFNSFMTDLTFFNFSFLAFYYLNEYTITKKWWQLFLVFSFAVLATLTRQLGLALFLAYVLVEIIKNYKTPKQWLIPLFLLAGGLGVLYLFELFESSRFRWDWSYQGVFLSPTKIPLGVDAIPRMYHKTFFIIKNSGLWLLLIFVLTQPVFFERLKKSQKLILFIFPCLFIIYLSSHLNEHYLGDVFIDLGVGIESTVDMLMIYATDLHSTNAFFYTLLLFLFFAGYFLLALFVGSSPWARIKELTVSQLFIITIICLYLILIGIADSSFDRYCIFFGLFVIVYVMSNTIVYSNLSLNLSVIVFIVIFSFSVFATKDYLTAARLKKQILNELAVNDKIIPERVNAGFEYQLWDRSDNQVNWINWDHLSDKICLITRRPVNEYNIFKTYTYQRFVPFKTDTFFVLKKIR
ncbi:MAG: glycosyltransferase family 39 protein [Bacteroidia bacterium]|nr:glycosyltransferase family 39 protein [Bacteroidia bacterium]